ncbi:response regulator [Bacteriovoracaceae bacterium]|nr:response regulator [Bacteriovoracaceae bacterium]
MKIYLIDDSSTFIMHMSEIISQIPNVKIISFRDPAEALSKVSEDRPDIIITDLEMPVMNGDELCRKIRSIKEFITTPILMITSKNGDDAYMTAITAGADDYLCKSSKEKVIKVKIQTLLRKASWLNQDSQSKQLEAIQSLIVLTNHEFNNSLMIANGFLNKISKENPDINKEHILKISNSLKLIEKTIIQLKNVTSFQSEEYVDGVKMLKLK